MGAADLETMDCAHKALKAIATWLGYPELEKEQSEAVLSFVQGRMFLYPCQQDMANHFAMA